MKLVYYVLPSLAWFKFFAVFIVIVQYVLLQCVAQKTSQAVQWSTHGF